MNLKDIMILLLKFKDTMKSGLPNVTNHTNQKPSRQHFGSNQGGSSNGPVLIELGHMKPQDKPRKDLLKVCCYNCGQMGHYMKDCLQRKKGKISYLDTMRSSSDSTDVTQ